MTTRADVDRLTRANRAVVKQARADLRRFFASLAGTPEDRAAALIEFVPVLVREYGDLAAAVTAQWYEEVRAEYGLPPFDVAPGGLADEAAVTGSARYAASRVFDGNSEGALSILMGAIQRHITYSTRDTVRRNVARDPGKPRFARVPSGAETCAFCEMLASRGFVYHTQAKAGEGDEYHDECDCQVVPEWDADGNHIAGYDPDAMYERYLEARQIVEASLPPGAPIATSDILAALRRLYPDLYTDGVHDH